MIAPHLLFVVEIWPILMPAGAIAWLIIKYSKKAKGYKSKADLSSYRWNDEDNIFSSDELCAKHIQSDKNASAVKEIVMHEFPVLHSWTESDRTKFIWRTMRIRESKYFQGVEGFEVTIENEILISATLARLTFGWKNCFHLPTFEIIEIYPAHFYSKLVSNYVEGLTLGNGRLFLSWRHFEVGHDNPTDKKHLGIHEFAHAMMIEFDMFRYAPQWRTWEFEALPIMESVQEDQDHFFRRYGGTNIHEFWAVTVETFFEQPAEFARKFPKLFYFTCAMLNQWPVEHEIRRFEHGIEP